MNDKTENCNRKTDTRPEQAFPWHSDPFLSKVPQSVRDQVENYGRRREPGREKLLEELQRHAQERLGAYDKATRQYQNELLQVFEMSLQSKSARRGCAKSRDIERDR